MVTNYNRSERLPQTIIKTAAWIAVIILGLGVIAVFVITPAIKFKPALQECRNTLPLIIESERRFKARNGRYTESFCEIAGVLPASSVYGFGYFLSGSGKHLNSCSSIDHRIVDASELEPDPKYLERNNGTMVSFSDVPDVVRGGAHIGLQGTCPECEIVVACVGIFAGEKHVWTASTADRRGEGTYLKPAGAPLEE